MKRSSTTMRWCNNVTYWAIKIQIQFNESNINQLSKSVVIKNERKSHCNLCTSKSGLKSSNEIHKWIWPPFHSGSRSNEAQLVHVIFWVEEMFWLSKEDNLLERILVTSLDGWSYEDASKLGVIRISMLLRRRMRACFGSFCTFLTSHRRSFFTIFC